MRLQLFFLCLFFLVSPSFAETDNLNDLLSPRLIYEYSGHGPATQYDLAFENVDGELIIRRANLKFHIDPGGDQWSGTVKSFTRKGDKVILKIEWLAANLFIFGQKTRTMVLNLRTGKVRMRRTILGIPGPFGFHSERHRKLPSEFQSSNGGESWAINLKAGRVEKPFSEAWAINSVGRRIEKPFKEDPKVYLHEGAESTFFAKEKSPSRMHELIVYLKPKLRGDIDRSMQEYRFLLESGHNGLRLLDVYGVAERRVDQKDARSVGQRSFIAYNIGLDQVTRFTHDVKSNAFTIEFLDENTSSRIEINPSKFTAKFTHSQGLGKVSYRNGPGMPLEFDIIQTSRKEFTERKQESWHRATHSYGRPYVPFNKVFRSGEKHHETIKIISCRQLF